MEAEIEDQDVLYNLATECESLFEDVHAALKETNAGVGVHELCAEFQQRFAIWTAHLGVFALKSQCLDTRLRNFPDLQDVTVRLLDLLRRCLDQWKSAASRPVGEGMDQLQTTLHGIDDTLSRLNNLGVTIRQSSADKIDLKARNIATKSNSTLFRYLCAQAVQTLYPGTSQALKDWLIHFMAVRWGRVMHLGKRHELLSTRRTPREGLETILEASTAASQTSQEATHPPVSMAKNNLRLPLASATQSDLSSINIQQIKSRNRPPDERSTKFAKTLSVQIKQGNYPKPPGNEVGKSHFACPWCSEMFDKSRLTDSMWRRHIDRDLKPYVCLSGDCPEADNGYATFSRWSEHMQLHGRRWHQKLYPTLAWICTVCQSDSHAYDTPQALYSHLQESHTNDFTEPQLQTISRQSKKEQSRALDDCLLCSFAVGDEQRAEHEAGKKRQKGPFVDEPMKSARISLEIRSAGPHDHRSEALDSASDSDTDSDSSWKSEITEPKFIKDRSVAAAKHIASHLQVLMLLTLRLATLTNDRRDIDDDEINSNSVEWDEEEDSVGGDSAKSSFPDLDDEMDKDELADDITGQTEDIPKDVLEVPDCDVELIIPSRYDKFEAKDDHFLQGVLLSGAYRSWQNSHDRNDAQTTNTDDVKAIGLDDIEETVAAKTEERSSLGELEQKLVLRPEYQSILELSSSERRLIYQGYLVLFITEVDEWIGYTYAILFDHYLVLAREVTAKDGQTKYDISEEPIPISLLTLGNNNEAPIERERVVTREVPVPEGHISRFIYPFEVKRLGQGFSYTLSAHSSYDRAEWWRHLCEAQANHAQALYRQNSEPFKLRVLSDAAFAYDSNLSLADVSFFLVPDTPLDRAIYAAERTSGPAQGIPPISRSQGNCAAAFTAYGKSAIAVGTDNGVFISDSEDPRGWQRAVQILRVTQIAILEEFAVCLVISDHSLISYPLQAILPVSDSEPPVDNIRRAPQRISTNVTYFTTAKMKDRTLIFYKRKEGSHTTFKVLEPLYPRVSEKRNRFFGTRRTPEVYRDYDEFFIPSECYSLSIFQTYIGVATPRGFEMLTLDKKQPVSIPDLRDPAMASIADRIRDQRPLQMFRLNDNEFILAYEKCAVYVDKHGDISRSFVMEYIGQHKGVTSATMHGRYLLLSTPDYVEVRNAESGELCQVIVGEDVRIIDPGVSGAVGGNDPISQTQTEDSVDELLSMGGGSKSTVKISMSHPVQRGRQLVLEMLLKDEHI